MGEAVADDRNKATAWPFWREHAVRSRVGWMVLGGLLGSLIIALPALLALRDLPSWPPRHPVRHAGLVTDKRSDHDDGPQIRVQFTDQRRLRNVWLDDYGDHHRNQRVTVIEDRNDPHNLGLVGDPGDPAWLILLLLGVYLIPGVGIALVVVVWAVSRRWAAHAADTERVLCGSTIRARKGLGNVLLLRPAPDTAPIAALRLCRRPERALDNDPVAVRGRLRSFGVAVARHDDEILWTKGRIRIGRRAVRFATVEPTSPPLLPFGTGWGPTVQTSPTPGSTATTPPPPPEVAPRPNTTGFALLEGWPPGPTPEPWNGMIETAGAPIGLTVILALAFASAIACIVAAVSVPPNSGVYGSVVAAYVLAISLIILCWRGVIRREGLVAATTVSVGAAGIAADLWRFNTAACMAAYAAAIAVLGAVAVAARKRWTAGGTPSDVAQKPVHTRPSCWALSWRIASAVGAIVAGIVMLATTTVRQRDDAAFRSHAAHAPATVTKVEEDASIRVRWMTPDGTVRSTRYNRNDTTGYQRGSHVTVLYDRHDPTHTALRGAPYRWWIATMSALLVMVLGAAPLVSGLRRRRTQSRAVRNLASARTAYGDVVRTGVRGRRAWLVLSAPAAVQPATQSVGLLAVRLARRRSGSLEYQPIEVRGQLRSGGTVVARTAEMVLWTRGTVLDAKRSLTIARRSTSPPSHGQHPGGDP